MVTMIWVCDGQGHSADPILASPGTRCGLLDLPRAMCLALSSGPHGDPRGSRQVPGPHIPDSAGTARLSASCATRTQRGRYRAAYTSGVSRRPASRERAMKPCRDCLPGTKRPTPHPGPRCVTHHRVVVKARKEAAHERMVQKTYGLGPGDYARLLAAQGGKCWICQRATGARKRLAVDHDHSSGEVRGILCGPCNQLLGHVRNDPDVLIRAAQYLINPPARRFL